MFHALFGLNVISFKIGLQLLAYNEHAWLVAAVKIYELKGRFGTRKIKSS